MVFWPLDSPQSVFQSGFLVEKPEILDVILANDESRATRLIINLLDADN